MKRIEWNLLVIAAGLGQPLTPVQLQKSLFLLGREKADIVGADYYCFDAYDYGPFTADVYLDAERLAAVDFISISTRSGQRWKQYAATPAGMAQAKKLKEQVSAETWRFIESTVEWVMTLTFRDLVTAVYDRYPEFRANSIFRG